MLFLKILVRTHCNSIYLIYLIKTKLKPIKIKLVMKQSLIIILTCLSLSSCINQDAIKVSFKNAYNSVIKKSGSIVEGFGEQGSVSLTYSD